MSEMTYLCGQAIDWKKDSLLADHGTDTAIRNLLESLSEKVKDTNMEALMRDIKIVSENIKNLGEDGILQSYKTK